MNKNQKIILSISTAIFVFFWILFADDYYDEPIFLYITFPSFFAILGLWLYAFHSSK